MNHELGQVPVWQPVLARDLQAVPAPELTSAERAELERRAIELCVQPLRRPPAQAPDTETAMLAATFAQQAGRVVAFSLAAFRQAFAAGRDLSAIDNVLIAAAACELHPRALLKGIESRSVRDRLARATREAASLGVREVPAIAAAGHLFEGEHCVEDAARVLARAAAARDDQR